jgi:hypothetical protein
MENTNYPLPRYARVNQPPHMRFTRRDQRILEAIHAFDGLLGFSQIQRLFFSCKSLTERRMMLLYQHKYVNRPNYEERRRVPEMIYWLDKRGAEVVASLEVYSPHMGPMEDLQNIGRSMFNKLQMQAYGLVCDKELEDKEDRNKIVVALGIGTEAAVIALTSVLIGTFGLAAALAGVVAALIIKRFAEPTLKEGQDAMCEMWKEYLPSKQIARSRTRIPKKPLKK